jgi:PKD repeat protein
MALVFFNVILKNDTASRIAYLNEAYMDSLTGSAVPDGQWFSPVGITVHPTGGMAPLMVVFTSAVSGQGIVIASYAWDFGDGSISTEQNPSHTYDKAGTYTAKVEATDNRGAKAGASVIITVSSPVPNQPPTVSASANPTSGNEPLTVNFIATAQDPDGTIASYLWRFGDRSISNTQNPTHTYNTAGTYTARVKVTDNGGATARASIPIVVNPPSDTTPPKVTIARPEDGVVVNSSSMVVAGTVDDPLVTSVNVNGQTVAVTTGRWQTTVALAKGLNTITVRATDAAGNVGQASVNVTYQPDDTLPPTVTILSPQNGSIVKRVVHITVTASDDVEIASIALAIDGKRVAQTTGVLLGYGWSTREVTKGLHTIQATAVDTRGNANTHTIQVTVGGANVQKDPAKGRK